MAADTTTRPSSSTRRGDGPRGLPVLRWVLRERRRALLLWAVALAAVSAIYAGFWDLMGDTGDLAALVEGMPDGLVQALGYDRIGSAAGYLESTVFGLLAPALLLVFGLGAGARVLAAAEEDGTLELELTLPITRRRVLLERYAAVVTQLIGLVAVVFVVVTAVAAAQDMDVAVAGIAAASLGLWLFVVAMTSIGFAAGAATGRRGMALGVGAGVAVAAFMADALAPMLEDGTWLERLSPFSWYLAGDPLVEGVDPAGFGGLLLLALLGLGVAMATFDRRDLGV